MGSHRGLRCTLLVSRVLCLALVMACCATAFGERFEIKNLVTDNQLANPGQITDSALVNPWGIALSGTGPFWVSDNGTGVSTLYSVNPTTNATTKLGLTVTIPGNGSVTGQAFNTGAASGAFNGNAFLFVSEDGTISGWRGALGTTAEILVSPSNAVYKGTALATVGGNTYLYAANFQSGKIDVFKGTAGAPNLIGSFTDPNQPAGYAPFNVQLLGGKLYVTYAKIGAGGEEEAGAGLGFVNVFDTDGNLVGRVGTGDTLNAPWGLAIAPTSFGDLAGDLLVGNFGDGTINAFDLASNSFVGQLKGVDGTPLSIDGLWGLTVGNDGNGGSSQKIYFTAGPGDETHGLFGSIRAVPEPGSLVLALIAVGGLVVPARKAALRRRNHGA